MRSSGGTTQLTWDRQAGRRLGWGGWVVMNAEEGEVYVLGYYEVYVYGVDCLFLFFFWRKTLSDTERLSDDKTANTDTHTELSHTESADQI